MTGRKIMLGRGWVREGQVEREQNERVRETKKGDDKGKEKERTRSRGRERVSDIGGFGEVQIQREGNEGKKGANILGKRK